MPRRPLPALAALCALGLAGLAGSSAAGPPAAALTPAPPPAGYCRAAPASGWSMVGPAPAAIPDLSGYQDYRAGLGMPPGFSGAGIDLADIEYEWAAGHAEFAARALPGPSANNLPPEYLARDHGTAVLGILGGADDGHGITGLAAGAALRPRSPFSGSPQTTYDPAKAITAAAGGLGAGDVMLIELQALVPTGGGDALGPIEYHESVRAAIAAAVQKGIVVVEPAGNGGLDVGTLGVPWLADRGHAKATGALIIGAGAPGGLSELAERERVPGSNYGARVDVQGVGAAVVTAGYSDLSAVGAGSGRSYTACFDGTSSAAATVAAGVAVLQEAAIDLTGDPLSPAEVRELLISTGLPQQPSAAAQAVAGVGNIGPRPQIAAAVATFGPTAPPPPAPPPPPPPITPPLGGGEVAAETDPDELLVPVPFLSGTARRAPAARGIAVRIDRSSHRLVVTLRGAGPATVVRSGGRRITPVRGRVVLSGVFTGPLVVRISAPGRRPVMFRIVVPVTGAPTARRL